MLAWSRPGRKSAGRPCIRAWRIIRSSTALRWAWPRWRLPGHVGRRLDDDEGRLAGVRAGAGAVGGEDVGGEPALVDRALELAGPVGLREPAAGSLAAVACVGHRRRSLETERPARPADERGRGTTCWFGRRRGPLIAARGLRRPSRRAIGRQPHGSRATFTPGSARAARTVPRSLRALPALLLPVTAVKAASLARGLRVRRPERRRVALPEPAVGSARPRSARAAPPADSRDGVDQGSAAVVWWCSPLDLRYQTFVVDASAVLTASPARPGSTVRASFVPRRCRLCTRPSSGARFATSRATASPASAGCGSGSPATPCSGSRAWTWRPGMGSTTTRVRGPHERPDAFDHGNWREASKGSLDRVDRRAR